MDETIQHVSVTVEPAVQQENSLSLLSYGQWSYEELLAREQILTAEIQKQSMMISESESDDISFLLSQKKLYGEISSVLSVISKVLGAAGPIALVLTTALAAPSFSNYVIAGITGTAVPLYHFSEQMRISSISYEKQAMTAFNNNVIDLQKVKAARKAHTERRLRRKMRKSQAEK